MCVRVCVCVHVRTRSVVQSCLTLCDPMDCSLRGSSIHGILQARIPEWVAIPFSRKMILECKIMKYRHIHGKKDFLGDPVVKNLPSNAGYMV